ncbi:hypothetical protein KAI04_02550 [Candidatus Pacearchaeota archaeon]|nr:hypothetical protein [Candidatus Pacearchaeota archaeon]
MAKKKKAVKKEVTEIVKIEKDGKEKTKIFHGKEEIKHASKDQIKRQKKQLNIILSILGLFILLFALVLFINYKTAHFTYEGVKFEIVKEGNLVFYNTAFPIYSEDGEKISNYNFYIRNNPKKLEKVPFIGELSLSENMVINMTGNFDCNGDGVIAIANIVNLYNFLGTEVIKDEEAGCDATGKYVFLQIEAGNETKVEQFWNTCYKITINECEILEGTERFMLETFVEINKILN